MTEKALDLCLVYYTYRSLVSFCRLQVPSNFFGSFWKSKIRGALRLTCIIFLLKLLLSFLVSSGSEVSLVCTLWIFSTAASIKHISL